MGSELLIPSLLAVFGALGLGAMGLVGIRIWANQSRGISLSESVDSLREQWREDIRDEIESAFDARQSEIDDLHGRLDFAERMLSQARLPAGGTEDKGAKG